MTSCNKLGVLGFDNYSVKVRSTVLVRPAKPTPYEFKQLSDIDDQESLRSQIALIFFYERINVIIDSTGRINPAEVVKDALSKLLVYYYPFAGRLREGPYRKLTVECTGEGVLFVEADADVTLRDFGDEYSMGPPFPCIHKLLINNVPDHDGILNSPLLLFQVTRLRCGGFIMTVRLNHTMSNASGICQFLIALGEIARGAAAPTITPVWDRHLLRARIPPCVTRTHHEFDNVPAADETKNSQEMVYSDMIMNIKEVHKSFFFSSEDVAAMRKHLPPHLINSTTKFELITACLWKCRTIALRLHPEDDVRVIFIFNTRSKFKPSLPEGYYGNSSATPAAVTTVSKLCSSPVGYAVELIKQAKEKVTEEYMRSLADFLVLNGRPPYTMVRTFLVSDVTRGGFEQVDIGWGEPVYGGPAMGNVCSFHIPHKNRKGEAGTLVPLCLPASAMEIFEAELHKLLSVNPVLLQENKRRGVFVSSSL